MGRPTHVSDVKTRYNEIATVYLDDIMNRPALMRAYTGLIEAAEKAGGRIIKKYSTCVSVEIPKSHAQMVEQLESEQRQWDRAKEQYDGAVNDPASVSSEWSRKEISRWAEDEDLDDPFVQDTEPAEA
jgi:hypothetical protein